MSDSSFSTALGSVIGGPLKQHLMVPGAAGAGSRPATELEQVLVELQGAADATGSMLAGVLERIGKAKDLGPLADAQHQAAMTTVDRLGQLSDTLGRVKTFAEQVARFV